jgi:hypothetical protein
MPVENLIEAVRNLTSKELEELLRQRQADDKALRALWRAALSREREERRQAREASHAG